MFALGPARLHSRDVISPPINSMIESICDSREVLSLGQTCLDSRFLTLVQPKLVASLCKC